MRGSNVRPKAFPDLDGSPGRVRYYFETREFARGWEAREELTPWVGADELDLPDSQIRLPPQLYNLDAVAYESLMLGLFAVWRGPNNEDVKGAGTLETRLVPFTGRHLFVNANVAGGELRAEVLDPNGRVVEPFSLANCEPLRAGKTLQEVHWKGASDLGNVAVRYGCGSTCETAACIRFGSAPNARAPVTATLQQVVRALRGPAIR